jgi:hypothetical protein
MELAKNAMRSNIQDMSNQEYEEFIEKMLKEADSDAEAGEIKTMYDKIRGAKAKGGKVPGYRYGTPKGGVKKMKPCRGRKAQGNKD